MKLVGIVNITPDSFSDGGNYIAADRAISHAYQLVKEGADYVDFGADSTRPGSSCVGPDEEWKRLEPVLTEISAQIPFSVDTHHAEIAKKAVTLGASIINDVSAAQDPEILKVIADSDARLVLMYSNSKRPHVFSDKNSSGDIITLIENFFTERIETALSSGVKKGQLILDTGMGAFISNEAEDSWEVVKRYAHFSKLGYPLLFGCSRKGFLKAADELEIEERDPVSALLAVYVSNVTAKVPEFYIRTHNIALHKNFLDTYQKLGLVVPSSIQ